MSGGQISRGKENGAAEIDHPPRVVAKTGWWTELGERNKCSLIEHCRDFIFSVTSLCQNKRGAFVAHYPRFRAIEPALCRYRLLVKLYILPLRILPR